MLIDGEKSLEDFLHSKQLALTDKALRYCGLRNEGKNEFNLEEHLQTSLKKYYQDSSMNKGSAL